VLSPNPLRHPFLYHTPKLYSQRLILELQVSINNLEDFQLKDLRISKALNQIVGEFMFF